jgi:hypothetical protein
MRFTRGDVRGQIVSSKIDHGPPQWRRQAMLQQRSPKIDFREIFWVVRFSTFATKSVTKPTLHLPSQMSALGSTADLVRSPADVAF